MKKGKRERKPKSNRKRSKEGWNRTGGPCIHVSPNNREKRNEVRTTQNSNKHKEDLSLTHQHPWLVSRRERNPQLLACFHDRLLLYTYLSYLASTASFLTDLTD